MARRSLRDLVPNTNEPVETEPVETVTAPVEEAPIRTIPVTIDADTNEPVTEEPAPKPRRASARRTDKPKADPRPPSAGKTLKVNSSDFRIEGMEGELGSDLFEFPTLKLVQKGSKEADIDQDGDPALAGHFVIDGEDQGDEVDCVMMKMDFFYREITEKGDDRFGDTYKTKAEAEAAGVRFSRAAVGELLVYVDGDDYDETFEEGNVRIARFFFEATSMKVARRLNSHCGRTKSQYRDVWITLGNKITKSKQNQTYRELTISIGDTPTSEDLRAYARSWIQRDA